MSSNYGGLLDATILHLEDLKARGVRHVRVSPETLRALALPAGSVQLSVSSFQTATPVLPPAVPPVVVPARAGAGLRQMSAPRLFAKECRIRGRQH
jgi:hypothetical protein